MPAISAFRHRRFQFNIYSLLLAFVLLCAFTMGVSAVLHRARRQQSLVQAIEAIGGTIAYEHQVVNGQYVPAAPRKGPEWLNAIFGKDVFNSVAHVTLQKRQGTDTCLQRLGELKQLKSLALIDCEVNDIDMERLGALTTLEELELNGTTITDTGMRSLRQLLSLKILSLSGCSLTDSSLQYIDGMAQLELLFLDRNKLTDSGLKHLEHIKSLRQLYLLDTRVTDCGVDKLRVELPNCDIYSSPQ